MWTLGIDTLFWRMGMKFPPVGTLVLAASSADNNELVRWIVASFFNDVISFSIATRPFSHVAFPAFVSSSSTTCPSRTSISAWSSSTSLFHVCFKSLKGCFAVFSFFFQVDDLRRGLWRHFTIRYTLTMSISATCHVCKAHFGIIRTSRMRRHHTVVVRTSVRCHSGVIHELAIVFLARMFMVRVVGDSLSQQ